MGLSPSRAKAQDCWGGMGGSRHMLGSRPKAQARRKLKNKTKKGVEYCKREER